MPKSFPGSIFILLLLTLAGTRGASGQFRPDPGALIRSADHRDPAFEKRHITFLGSESNSAFVKYNPFTLAFGSLLFVYQSALSPQISADCRFRMSCSAFSKASIREFGLIKGIALTSDRIMKCNRLAMTDARPGEYDEFFKLYDTPQKYRIRR